MEDQAVDTTITAASDIFGKLLSGDDGTQDEPEDNAAVEGDDQAEEGAEEAPEEAEDEQPAEETDEDEDEPQVFTVRIDGKDSQVTADELVKGYQRNADYTRKTQELAERRKSADGELEAVKAEREHYRNNLQKLIDLYQQSAPQEPNWVQLAAENPAEYVRQHALFEQSKLRQRVLDAERAQVEAKSAEDEAREEAANIEAEKAKLFEAIPEWKDAKKLRADKAALEVFAAEIGFDPDDVSTVKDHRLLVILRESMLYRRGLQARKAQPQAKPATRVVAPGGRDGAPQKGVRAREFDQLKKTGDVYDAARVLERLM